MPLALASGTFAPPVWRTQQMPPDPGDVPMDPPYHPPEEPVLPPDTNPMGPVTDPPIISVPSPVTM